MQNGGKNQVTRVTWKPGNSSYLVLMLNPSFVYIHTNHKRTLIQKVFYLKSCYVKLCQWLHLANYDITISPLQIRNTGYAEVSFCITAKSMKLNKFFNFASIAAAEKRPLSYKTPLSFHRPRYCGVQTLPLRGWKIGGKLGKEWSDFDPQRMGSYFWGSGLWCKLKFHQNWVRIATVREVHDRRTDRQTDAGDFIICPTPMLCYSNGTDNNLKMLQKYRNILKN